MSMSEYDFKLLCFRMNYANRVKRVGHVIDVISNNSECRTTNDFEYKKLATAQNRFDYQNTKTFAWTAVLSDDMDTIIELMHSMMDDIKALTKKVEALESGKQTNDSDINIGGF